MGACKRSERAVNRAVLDSLDENEAMDTHGSGQNEDAKNKQILTLSVNKSPFPAISVIAKNLSNLTGLP